MSKKIIKYLNEIIVKVDELKAIHNQKYDSELLIAYRGEPKYYGETKLMPSLFRNPSYVKKEKYLFELFSDYGLISNDKRNVDKAIETQHYAAISRMLDITFNAIVAIYFACQEDDNQDGFVYVFGFPEHYSPSSSFIEDFYTNILNSGNNISYFKNFKVFSHSYSNDRIKAQNGGFIFFPGSEYRPINMIYYRNVEIAVEDKEVLLDEINILFQINDAKLFPEKENIAKVIKEKFISASYNNKKLSIKTEVDSYFDRIYYEMSVLNKVDKKEIIRYLRKEEDDILYYVKKQTELSEAEKNSLMQEITDNFKCVRVF